MKQLYVLLLLLVATLIDSGCKKDTHVPPILARPYNPNPASAAQTANNTAPVAFAGYDYLVELPTNEIMLVGAAYDNENNMNGYKWEKISGPNSFTLSSNNTQSVKVTNLEKGIYEFKLTVADVAGLEGKDTLTVIVGQLPANPKEVILKEKSWVCPWDCCIQISNLYSHLPAGSFFKVFIQRDASVNWIEVPGVESYFYQLNDGLLLVWNYEDYSTFVYDTPSIKLVY